MSNNEIESRSNFIFISLFINLLFDILDSNHNPRLLLITLYDPFA